MKNKFALAVLTVLLSVSAHSQFNTTTRLLDDLETASVGKLVRKESPEIQGSPYIKRIFMPANVSNVAKSALMRYDVYNDEFEFVNAKKDTLILDKVDTFNTITFADSNLKYQFADYTNHKNKKIKGYLILLQEKNGYALLKKQTVIFVEQKVNSVPFETIIPAKFVQTDDFFYFKNKDLGITEFPTSKKGLIKLFPEKKAEIEAFIKQNNIDFDKESDKLKIFDFLAI